ncbi:MAG: tetratricopeptide repeat protein [candidate division Zixibacteria bacterium]|nr:tetratricopeptide repeat protein [candidate division Zixibacteria bacterium]
MKPVRTNFTGLCGVAVMLLIWACSPAAGAVLKPEIADALNRHDTTQVLTLIDNVLKIDPTDGTCYLLRGQILFTRGKLPEALDEFERALKIKATRYEALYYKGLIFLKQNKPEEARVAFDEGVKKARDEKALFHNGMGLYLIADGKYAEADVEFRKASQIGPDQAEYHANLGDANFYAKIYPLAISEYNATIAMDTTFLDVYFRLARAYVAQGQFNEALDQLRIVLTRDSLYTYAWKEIGKLYTLAGLSARDTETKSQRFKEAIGSYRKFFDLSHDSTDGEPLYNLGRAYFNLSAYAEADSAFKQVLATGNTPASIYLYLGRCAIGQDQYEVGIDYLKKHLAGLEERAPGTDENGATGDMADILRRIADAYKAIQNYDSASAYYVTATGLDTTNAKAMFDAALSYHQLKDYASALPYYEKRIALGPDAWNVYLNAAYCTLNLQDYEKSVAFLKKVVELDSANEKTYPLLSNTYVYQLKNCEEGLTWSQKWLQRDPNNCDALKNMGFLYFGGICQSDNLKAIGYFTRALSCQRTKGSGDCANADLMTYIAQANHFNAVSLAEQKQKAESKKYFKEAFDWYKKVVKCEPGNEAAKKGIKDTEFEY